MSERRHDPIARLSHGSTPKPKDSKFGARSLAHMHLDVNRQGIEAKDAA
jgi:hypothetical protein